MGQKFGSPSGGVIAGACLAAIVIIILAFAIQVGLILLVWNYLLVPYLHWKPIGLGESLLVATLFSLVRSIFYHFPTSKT